MADVEFSIPDEPLCACEHPIEEHRFIPNAESGDGDSPCGAKGCRCLDYEPEDLT